MMHLLTRIACVILLGACSVAHAGYISIDANNFAPETNISYSTPGVTMSAMGYVYSYSESPSIAVYTPVLTGPVYSHALSVDLCSMEYNPPSGVSCPASGNQVLSPAAGSGITVDEAAWRLGGGEPGPPCLGPCINRMATDTLLRIDFATPTNYVDALGLQVGGDPPAMWAYDAAGNLVASCEGFVDPCSEGYVTSASDWLKLSVSTPSSDISTVLLSGENQHLLFERFGYAPEPGTLGLMGIGLASIGFALRKRVRGIQRL